MQENKQLKRKMPSNLWYMIQQLTNEEEKPYYFTFLNSENSVSYVLQITKQKNTNIPRGLTQNLISQQEIIINQANKKNILSKFTTCSCDQLNNIIRKYFVLNFNFSGVFGLDVSLRAFQYYTASDSSQSKIVCVDKLSVLLQFFIQKTNQIWSNYESKYCRSLSQKKNKQGVQITYSIQTFLQYEVKCLTTLQSNEKINTKIEEPQVYNYLFSTLIQVGLTNSFSNLQLMIKQKVEEINNKIQSLKILKLERPNLFWCLRGNPSKIFNPHIYSKFSKKQKYQLIMVKGMYQYYHYGDQNSHDNGWGCAYRALQTLISWLNIQGYTQPMKQMITINQIQEKLDSFDRTRKLKGSNTWIGATQISWIVPKITINNLNCKILHVSNGKNILQKCEQFKNHFLTSGCPIMYGGGQYAYSIVGMHYNWKLGECQFLILDPHYTGEDDFGKILQKKGLAWRKPEQMFKAGVFYNFCLPIIK